MDDAIDRNHRGRLDTRLAAVVAVVALVAAGCGSPRSEFAAEGRDLYTANACSTCHGGRGQGGVGPSLASVTETFPSCSAQIEWVRLGSEGWLQQRGDTYGSTAKSISGGMPGFGGQLSDTELATVVAYERAEFGGVEEAAAQRDCGL